MCECVCACAHVSACTRVMGYHLLINGSKLCKGTEMKRLKVHLGDNENTRLFESDGLYMVNGGIQGYKYRSEPHCRNSEY